MTQDEFKPDAKTTTTLIGAIERFKKVLKDPKADKQDRKEALLFVVHFVGDMHQPLHTGNREDDRGGNLATDQERLGQGRGQTEPAQSLGRPFGKRRRKAISPTTISSSGFSAKSRTRTAQNGARANQALGVGVARNRRRARLSIQRRQGDFPSATI